MATIALGYVALVTWETGVLLGKLCLLLPEGAASDYPSLAAEAMGRMSCSPAVVRIRRYWSLLRVNERKTEYEHHRVASEDYDVDGEFSLFAGVIGMYICVISWANALTFSMFLVLVYQ